MRHFQGFFEDSYGWFIPVRIPAPLDKNRWGGKNRNPVCDSLGSFGILWDSLGSFGILWDPLGSFGIAVVWKHSDLIMN